jgi:hypothetical protein
MKIYRTGILMLTLLLSQFAASCGTLQLDVEGALDDQGKQVEITATSTTEASSVETPAPPPDGAGSPNAAQGLYEFKELGISLVVPPGLNVVKEPLVSLDDPSRLDSYLFYIQNNGGSEGPGSDYFQMYGHLQYDLPSTTWEEFSQTQDNTTEFAYVNPVEINGVRGFEGQFSGTRNRYLYMFYLDGRVLKIAVADPTPENKVLADEIISTLEFNPAGMTSASHLKAVVDPNLYYQILVPEDWITTFNTTAGIRLSELEAHSPDYEVLLEEGAGQANIYYKHGVFMSLIVLEGGSDIGMPYESGIESQRSVYFDGVEGTEYRFVEPSTFEGKLREVRVAYEGRNYILRFGYANDADTDAIDQIIRNLSFLP